VLASAHEEVEGLVQKITLLEDELTEVRRAREVAEESSRGLSDKVANAERRWEVSKRDTRSSLRSYLLHRLLLSLCFCLLEQL
jgi:chromosome segregation ATPase